ncbi:MAG: DUF3375 domain-containing protein [Hydrotalea sp. AMD]|uniref:DUF3375 domain-containing protein n=1 Tax=Hydrotalea TaxID=1004300 RepID=UPI0008379938|nr:MULTISPECIES: DUF3375 domain-containing protein [Hydrotalea]RTL53328.1 MAG: DUF3375 domain-containing protein [Sphingobacteriales bacterium]RWZ86230.1 MAG: DUF3375 domain-containing protein [Hydrotalea sp. AMD]
MTFEEILVQFKTAKPLLLLRAKNAAFIISFFQKVFSDANVTTITNSELRSKLEGYMEELSYEEKDEELDAGTLFDDFSIRASQYIDKWSNGGFLSKYPNDEGEDLHELTPDTRKALKWIADLERREHVGTNSRFKDIFFKLQKMIEQTNEDAEARIEELQKKKWAIEDEINLLKSGKKPSVFDETEIKEQFYDLNKMARELLADFSEVEQNFEQIRKDIQRKYTEKDIAKGTLLVFALDALDDIDQKPQGKSFKAFWEFLMDERRQQEFTQLTERLYHLLNEHNIDYNNDRFLKHLKRYLHVSGRKVIDSNRKLSEKISRVLSEKNMLERRRAMELIGDIRQMAYSLIETKIKEDDFIVIEDEPYINLFDRWEPGEEKDDITGILFPDGTGEDGDADFKLLFDQFTIDRKKLLQRIDTMLEEKTQVTLKEIIDEYGIENGLSEIVGYFSIATSSTHHIIIEEAKEPILIGERKVNVPMVIYTRPTTN